jgi:hypothetical protein
LYRKQWTDAEADFATVGTEAFVEPQAAREPPAGDHDLLADTVLVGGKVTTMKSNMAVSEPEFDALDHLPANEPAEFRGIDPTLAVADPRDFLQRHPQLRRDGHDRVELFPCLCILLLCPAGAATSSSGKITKEGERYIETCWYASTDAGNARALKSRLALSFIQSGKERAPRSARTNKPSIYGNPTFSSPSRKSVATGRVRGSCARCAP